MISMLTTDPSQIFAKKKIVGTKKVDPMPVSIDSNNAPIEAIRAFMVSKCCKSNIYYLAKKNGANMSDIRELCRLTGFVIKDKKIVGDYHG